MVDSPDGEPICQVYGNGWCVERGEEYGEYDHALILNAPTDIAYLLEQLQASQVEITRLLNAGAKHEHELCDILGPVLGFPTGPFEDVCADCVGGPCAQVEKCSEQCLTAPYCSPELARTVVEQLHAAQAEVAGMRAWNSRLQRALWKKDAPLGKYETRIAQALKAIDALELDYILDDNTWEPRPNGFRNQNEVAKAIVKQFGFQPPSPGTQEGGKENG